MLTVYSVQLELGGKATLADVLRLRDHLKVVKIEVIGLDQEDFKPRMDELVFTVYGDVGPFMMKKMLEECTQNIFPGTILAIFHAG